jgi:nucleoside-diphosphate-sugar epimerase
MKTVLATGATGFIASHLLPVLHQQGWQIIAAIRNDLDQSLSIPITTIKIGEMDGKTNWDQALQGVDVIIHLAARAHILEDNIPNPEAEFLRVNTEGTINLVKQAIEAKVKHFIFISSIGVTATLSQQILTETSPCQPDTPYGRSKLKAEQALIELAKDSKMTWTILRPTLVYGAGNPGNMERLMKLVKLGLPLPFGAINNRRSFIYVGNLVDAIATCLTHPQAANQTFIVSDGQDFSTPELVRLIAQQMQRPCYFLPIPPSLLKMLAYVGDGVESLLKRPIPFNTSTLERLLGSLFVDSSHIQKTLNWQPPFTLEQGLKQTIQSNY